MTEGYQELIKIFQAIEKEMQSKFEQVREAIKHSGLKGGSIEEIVRQFFRERIPQSLSIAKGQVVDSNGKYSRELDLIIYDALKTPIFFKDEHVQVIPIECVYAIVEIKTKLDSTELTKIYDNMDSVRSLEKKAYFISKGDIKNTYNLYGKKWDYWPTNYFVFAYDSIDLIKLREQIEERDKSENRDPWNKIDIICVLNKGLIFYSDDVGWLPIPHQDARIHVEESGMILLRFYGLLMPLFTQMNNPPFRFFDYIRKVDP